MSASDSSATTALEAVLDAPDFDAAKAAARAGLDRINAPAHRLLPLKQARYALGLGDKQARRLAHAGEAEGIAVFTGGRWFIDVDAAAAKRKRRS